MKSIAKTHTLWTTQIDKNRQNKTLSTASEQVESHGYMHFLSRTFCNGAGGRTTRLQTHI